MSDLPASVRQVLSPDNPKLQQLRKDYAALDLPVTAPSLWQTSLLDNDLDLCHFRGDNPYVWQYRRVRSQAAMKYYLHLRYIETCDQLGLLEKLGEDGSFGCWTFDFARRTGVSRDLLDSINEINYLNAQLGICRKASLKILDIGAGYGRLAHRMCEALDNLDAYYCVDAIPESTFLCDFYLNHRDCERAVSVPLNDIDNRVPRSGIDVAVNIHSFSECTLAAVEWWLQWIAERQIPYLLIVPNDPKALLTTEVDGSKRDFAATVESFGYQLTHSVATINDDDIRRLTGIADHYYLYRLERAR